MSNFVLNVRCNNCSAIHESEAHGANFYNSFRSKICRTCGHHGFYDVSERWVSLATWWKPSTWFTGYWEEAER